MKKLYIFLLIAVLIVSFSIGYFWHGQKNSSVRIDDNTANDIATKPDDNSSKNDNPEKPEVDPIKLQISKMTLEEKIGQMVMAGIDSYNFDENSRKIIQDYNVGGFIILGQNVQSTKQLLNLMNSLKSTNSNNKIPLFLSVDQEGGRIERLPSEFKKFPTNKTIGGINNEKFSFNVGSALGEEVKAFGFNMDFAPVLDINSNPKNPVIGDRSFGDNADVVTRLGIQTMIGIKSQKVIPVVKHFPGHGDTAVDSHIGLPTVNNDIARLKSFELKPFSEAVKNGADVVMIAHILMPKIDAQNPASFSKTIISDILRKQLNFNGVVITDDMTMGAIMKNYNIGEAAVKSVNAGSDIILVAHEFNNEVAVLDALKNASNKGTISKERINESVYRILKLKEKYNLTDNTIKSVNVSDINNKINSVLNPYIKK